MSIRLFVPAIHASLSTALVELALTVIRVAAMACVVRPASLVSARRAIAWRGAALRSATRLFCLFDPRQKDANDIGLAISHLVALACRSLLVVVDVVFEMPLESGCVRRIRVHEQHHSDDEERVKVLVGADLHAVEEHRLAVKGDILETVDKVAAHLEVVQRSVETRFAAGEEFGAVRSAGSEQIRSMQGYPDRVDFGMKKEAVDVEKAVCVVERLVALDAVLGESRTEVEGQIVLQLAHVFVEGEDVADMDGML